MFRRLIADFSYICSLVGIWPRFIEPKLLKTTKIRLQIESLPKGLENLRIVQLTDLHLNAAQSDRYLKKIHQKVQKLNPDIIVFTGDFLCRSQLKDKARLKHFLNLFQAHYGCFAVLGNHDYDEWVTINSQGEYDLFDGKFFEVTKGFKRIFKQKPLKRVITERAKNVPLNHGLLEILNDSPFTLLHNKTVQLSINGETLNICGLGEYMCGQFKPEEAFSTYDKNHPGIILAHNPDGIPHLKEYPGELILCGHTHGAQVNLPFLWKKFTLLENPKFKRGLVKECKKWIYVNRGVGSVAPIRFGSSPEILFIHLEKVSCLQSASSC